MHSNQMQLDSNEVIFENSLGHDLVNDVVISASQAWLDSSLAEQVQKAFPAWRFFADLALPFDLQPSSLLMIVDQDLSNEHWQHLAQFRSWDPESLWLVFSRNPALMALADGSMLVNASILPLEALQPKLSLLATLANILRDHGLQKKLTDAFAQSNQSLREHWLQMRQELQAGQELQRRLFPKNFLFWPPFEFAHFLEPCNFLSGDFVDYFQLSDTLSMGILADVAGHGVSSAMVTMLVKTELHYLKQQYITGVSNQLVSLQELVSHLNTELLGLALSKHVTLFVFLLDRQLKKFDYINAAHLPLPMVRVNHQLQTLPITGVAVGLLPNQEWRQESLSFDQFELFTCSDGVLDGLQAKGQLAKESLLSKILATHHWRMPELLSALQDKMSGQVVDDITILLLRDTRS